MIFPFGHLMHFAHLLKDAAGGCEDESDRETELRVKLMLEQEIERRRRVAAVDHARLTALLNRLPRDEWARAQYALHSGDAGLVRQALARAQVFASWDPGRASSQKRDGRER